MMTDRLKYSIFNKAAWDRKQMGPNLWNTDFSLITTREAKMFFSNCLHTQIRFWVSPNFSCSSCINSKMVFSHPVAYMLCLVLLKVSLHIKKQQLFSITTSTFNFCSFETDHWTENSGIFYIQGLLLLEVILSCYFFK